MKKKNLELMRVQNVIENDRLSLGDGFEKLFINDLTKLLNDYFEIASPPNFNVNKTSKGYFVNFEFNVQSIKNVNYLP